MINSKYIDEELAPIIDELDSILNKLISFNTITFDEVKKLLLIIFNQKLAKENANPYIDSLIMVILRQITEDTQFIEQNCNCNEEFAYHEHFNLPFSNEDTEDGYDLLFSLLTKRSRRIMINYFL